MDDLLRISGLQTHYTSFGGSRVIKAVDGISFTLREGQTIGLVGESGCGKTTTCLSIVGLLPSAANIVGGSIEFDGEELTTKPPREMRHIRGRKIAMILQDPMASLNPLFSIYLQVAEPAFYHQRVRGRSLRQRVRDLFRAGTHPYTQALLGSMPKLGSKEPLFAIPGQPPNLARLPSGCAFHPRCRYAMPRCVEEEPVDGLIGVGWTARCWLTDQEPAKEAYASATA